MEIHIALLRVLEKLRISSHMPFDLISVSVESQRFQTWDQIEQIFFSENLLNIQKKEEIKVSWIKELDKVRSDQDFGISYVCLGDESYPHSFCWLSQPPLVFSYIGSNCWQNTACLSVVGSRDPHPYTTAWIKSELRGFIKSNNCTIVSGGARGVDFQAHSLCLDLEKPTVVILPSGIKKMYPESLKHHVKRIIECGGCIMSEYDSDFEVRKYLFQHRNRLIAAMNHALLIGEAKLQSGTIMTAHLALEMSRPVWVVPGHPMMSSYAGSLELIMYGGQLVRSAEDLKIFFETELYGISSFTKKKTLFSKKVKKNEKSL